MQIPICALPELLASFHYGKKCRSAAETSLSIAPESSLRTQLIECQKQAVAELSIKSRIDPEYGELRKQISQAEQNVDKIHSSSPTFNNLNMLQAAVLQGDVWLFEDVVSLGAGVDYPVFAESMEESMDDPNHTIVRAPQGTTALVLCCASLALYGKWIILKVFLTT